MTSLAQIKADRKQRKIDSTPIDRVSQHNPVIVAEARAKLIKLRARILAKNEVN